MRNLGNIVQQRPTLIHPLSISHDLLKNNDFTSIALISASLATFWIIVFDLLVSPRASLTIFWTSVLVPTNENLRNSSFTNRRTSGNSVKVRDPAIRSRFCTHSVRLLLQSQILQQGARVCPEHAWAQEAPPDAELKEMPPRTKSPEREKEV